MGRKKKGHANVKAEERRGGDTELAEFAHSDGRPDDKDVRRPYSSSSSSSSGGPLPRKDGGGSLLACPGEGRKEGEEGYGIF